MPPTRQTGLATSTDETVSEGSSKIEKPDRIRWSDIPGDCATDEERLRWLMRQQSASDFLTYPPTPPVFGSTSRKPGMNVQMASMNMRTHRPDIPPSPPSEPENESPLAQKPRASPLVREIRASSPSPSSGSGSPLAITIIEMGLGNPFVRGEEPPPPLPSPATLRRQLHETNLECCRYSIEENKLRSKENKNWEEKVAKKLIQFKHQELDKTQPSLLRTTRKLVYAEVLEKWWWSLKMKTSKKLHKKGSGKK